MTKKQLRLFLGSFIVTLILMVGAVALVWQAWRVIVPHFQGLGGNTANRNVVSFHDHFGLDPEIAGLVMDGGHLQDGGTPPIIEYRNGVPYVYLPASFLQAHVDPFLFWDDGAGVFFASTRYQMLEFIPGRTSFYVDGVSRPLATPVKRVNGEVFLPVAVVEGLYPLVVEYAPEYNIVMITSALEPQTVGMVSVNNAAVRYRPESRSPIAAQLSRGDEVVVFSDDAGSFVRVRTPQGLLGYILADEISGTSLTNRFDITGRTRILHDWVDNTTPRPPRWDGGKINLVWEAAHNQTANAIRMETPFHRGVTVVAPTWFDLDLETLSIRSVANRAYVDWAHAQGVYVWAKVFDMNNATARAILMDRDARRTVINQLVTYVERYNLDGINIDFEHLHAPQGPYKIQFLRELSVAMRDKDIVLSAAVLVPMPWSRFYRRGLIALTVDFVMVMAYDEHWSTSPVSGPVASLPWVQQGIIDMLYEVPRQQLLMGLPFYNRIWREVVDSDAPPTTRHLGMNATREFFAENGFTDWEWDSSIGSYYGYFITVEDGETVKYRVWLEDERSIAAKMQIYAVYDLAGVAGWRRGFESAGVWEVLYHGL